MYYSRIRNNGIISYDKTCKECRKQIQQKWSIDNKEKKKETDRIYRENNKIVQHDILIQELKVKFYMQHLQIAGKSLAFFNAFEE